MRHLIAGTPALLLLAALLTSVAAPPSAQADPQRQTLQERIDRIAQEVVETSTAGLAVAVVDGSEVDGSELGASEAGFLRAFGHTDAMQDRRLEVDSRLPVASISKVVTSLTALTLHEEGVVDLDAPIDQVSRVEMRDDRDPADRVPLTGRHLLTHHAGFAESVMWTPPAGSADLQRPLSDWLERHPPVLRHPAVGMHYSPLAAYTVLGAAIENAVGTDFDSAARRTVLGPVGADSATFRGDLAPADAAIVAPAENGFEAAPWPDTVEAPAATLRWSARDAAALMSALLADDGRLPARVVDQARTVSVRPQHGGGGHTHVFFENTRRGVEVLEHAGADGLAWLTLVPDAGVGVFVAVNSHDRAATEATDAVVDAVVDWAVDDGRAHPATGHPSPPIIPDWLPSSRPAIPTGTFQERLFLDRGPEKALRSLLGQVVVTADGGDLLMNGRRLTPDAEGRWCDPDGCVAGRVSGSGVTVLERGDRGMLEQTLTPAPIRDRRLTVVSALAAWAVVVLVVAVGALLRVIRRVRGRTPRPSPAATLALGWAATSATALALVLAIPLWPLVSGSTASTPLWTLWALTGLTTLSTGLAVGWAVTAARRRHAVPPRRAMAAAACVALIIPVHSYLLDWGFTFYS